MKNETEIKNMVREKYAQIAHQSKDGNAASCCGATGCSTEVYNIMTDNYDALDGYVPEADLGLGCGLPTQFARISPGDTVVDLGSGAGNDCFVARHETGPLGKVIGIDFTPEMIRLARLNAEKLGFNNVEFREGDLEQMPVSDGAADVVVSNCVLNLVPNKTAVMAEIFRILKPGGHFSISDVVLVGELPQALQTEAEMYAGCVSGAIQKETYLSLMAEAGFQDLEVQKEKPIVIPDDVLSKYVDADGLAAWHHSRTGIFSVTVFGQKPGAQEKQPREELKAAVCAPGSGCC